MSELHIFVFIFTLAITARFAILYKWNLWKWSVAIFLVTGILHGSYYVLSELFSTPESVIRGVGMGLTGAVLFRVFCYCQRIGIGGDKSQKDG